MPKLATPGKALLAASMTLSRSNSMGTALPAEATSSKAEYYFENGLRKVRPFVQEHLTFAKARWIKRTVPEVFASEMSRRCTADMVKAAMGRGDILVNGKIVPPDYYLKGGEKVRSINCHRHEPPIPATKIHIIDQTADYVVFDKPHGMTVHPNELNFHNTALSILRHEHGIPTNLHAVNRLDAVTSGIVILAKSSDDSIRERFQPDFKEYVCRVSGEFPPGEVICSDPILQTAGKVSIDPSGKPSQTRFERIWYDAESNSSLVKCQLSTGRQHQIRLHIAGLKHPIVNDILYNPAYTSPNDTRFYPKDIPDNQQPYMPFYPSSEWPCHKCNADAILESDPDPAKMKIWLRAIRYKGADWDFRVEMPDWADPAVVS